MLYTFRFSENDYDKICRALTDYETEPDISNEQAMYDALVEIVRKMANVMN
jgi:hypothetical protein